MLEYPAIKLPDHKAPRVEVTGISLRSLGIDHSCERDERNGRAPRALLSAVFGRCKVNGKEFGGTIALAYGRKWTGKRDDNGEPITAVGWSVDYATGGARWHQFHPEDGHAINYGFTLSDSARAIMDALAESIAAEHGTEDFVRRGEAVRLEGHAITLRERADKLEAEAAELRERANEAATFANQVLPEVGAEWWGFSDRGGERFATRAEATKAAKAYHASRWRDPSMYPVPSVFCLLPLAPDVTLVP